MRKNILNAAMASGLTTQRDLKVFEMVYIKGQSDTYREVVEDAKEIIGDEPFEAFPLLAEASDESI